MEIFKAHQQWSKRPADERFWTLQDLRDACLEYRLTAVQAQVNYRDLRTEAQDGEVVLIGKTAQPAQLTHWAFGQLAQRAGAPAGYLRELPATLAVQNLNHGLKANQTLGSAKLLMHRNGGMLVRAMTGLDYARIWNHEVADHLLSLTRWAPPPARPQHDSAARPATQADIDGLPTSIQVGELIGPAGLYASDHDLFIFLIERNAVLEVGGTKLSRGVILWNSEVGVKFIGGTTFLFNHVCGNHIIWGACNVSTFRFRHVGAARERAFQSFRVDLAKYEESAMSLDAARIQKAQSFVLGATKEDVLDAVVKIVQKSHLNISRVALSGAVDTAEARVDRYGNPRTVWAVANGISENSQNSPYMDERMELDAAAGKLMEVAF
jgi:hypothetical protein